MVGGERDRVELRRAGHFLSFQLQQHPLEAGFVETLFEIRVEMILNGVIRSSVEISDHLAPAYPVNQVKFDDEQVLQRRPLPLVQVGIQVVSPSLPTLLSNATRQFSRNLGPVLWAVPLHEVHENGVLALRPGAPYKVSTVIKRQPARVATDL